MGKILQGNHSGEELHDEMMEEQAREVKEAQEDRFVEYKLMIDKGEDKVPEWIVLFVYQDTVVHHVIYEDEPTVVSVLDDIDDLKEEKFGLGERNVNLCSILILPIETGGGV